jgi:hypothetical protein
MNYHKYYKLLSKPNEWHIVNKNRFTERYQHTSGVWTYTNLDFISFRESADSFLDGPRTSSFFHFMYIILTFKERRFRNALKKLGKL